MVRFLEMVTQFPFSWDQVAQGFWMRYPNPHSGHVLSEDTISREVHGDKLYSKRILTKTNRMPKWGARFVGKTHVIIIEESIVDRRNCSITTYTRNVGYTNIMSVIEKVVYRPSTKHLNETVAERHAWVDSKVFGFSRAIQALGADRFKKNSHKAALGFQYVLNGLFPLLKNEELTVGGLEQASSSRTKLAEKAQKLTGPLYAACQSTSLLSEADS